MGQQVFFFLPNNLQISPGTHDVTSQKTVLCIVMQGRFLIPQTRLFYDVGIKYRWTDVSAYNTFQDLPRLRKTSDNTERYTGCNRRNGPDFGRVFLRSNYTDITQNTHIQSCTVTEILAREKSGLLWCLRTVLVSVTSFSPLLELHSYVRTNVAPAT